MKTIDKMISMLTSVQKKYLYDRLAKHFSLNLSKEISACPCCHGTDFKKHGSYKDKPKFKCMKTQKVFSYKTGTSISGIDSDKFNELLVTMTHKSFLTVDEIEQKFSLSSKTAFDWRNKIITALYKEIDMNSHVIEFDETNFMISRKGRKNMNYSRERGTKLVGDNPYNVKVFMAYSRTSKKLELYVSHMGRTCSQDVENYLGKKKDLVVYSDKHQAYVKYYKQRNIVNGVFKSSKHVSSTDKLVHNQTINYYTGKIKKFINDDLRGVSTKYLQGYLNWFMFLHNMLQQNEETVEKAVVENKVALDIFKQKEKEFQYFLRNNGRTNYGTYNDKYYG